MSHKPARDGFVAAFLIYVLVLALVVSVAIGMRRDHERHTAIIQAAWPRCFTQADPPLAQPPMPAIDRDSHRPRDGGIS
jgi:hypothetical protein